MLQEIDGNVNHGGSINKQPRTEKVGVGLDTSTPQRRSPLNLANLKTYGNLSSLYNFMVSRTNIISQCFRKLNHYGENLDYCYSITDKPDTLICGNCKEMFRNIVDIINHKRHYCKLRFACKCLPSPNALSILKDSRLSNDIEEVDKGR